MDGNLDTRVHLKMSSDTWILFDLQKSHSITGFRIYPAWSNGPKRVKIQFAGRESGPFIDAAEFEVGGEDGGAYVVVRWQGKIMQGYRNEGLQTSKFFDAGIVPKGRYFRLFIINAWSGKYGKAVEEVEFQSKLLLQKSSFSEGRFSWGSQESIEKRVRTVTHTIGTLGSGISVVKQVQQINFCD